MENVNCRNAQKKKIFPFYQCIIRIYCMTAFNYLQHFCALDRAFYAIKCKNIPSKKKPRNPEICLFFQLTLLIWWSFAWKSQNQIHLLAQLLVNIAKIRWCWIFFLNLRIFFCCSIFCALAFNAFYSHWLWNVFLFFSIGNQLWSINWYELCIVVVSREKERDGGKRS